MLLSSNPQNTHQTLLNALTMHSLFEDGAEHNPDQIAVRFAGDSLSYGELNRRANQLAHYLIKLQIPRESFIAISLPRSMELFIAVMGVLKAGCAYVPLDETQPDERLMYILDDTKAPILITQAATVDKFSLYQGKKIMLDTQWQNINTFPSANPTPIAGPENLAYVIYTSGSTGRPKGVLIEHKSLVNYIKWFGQYCGCQSQDRIDFSSNFIFDMAITSSVAALALNLQVVICPEEIKMNTQNYLRHLNQYKINLIKITPSYFKLLVQDAKKYSITLEDLQSVILGGENLLTIDCIHWLDIYPKHHLFNEYGPTETTVAVTQFKISHDNVHHLGISAPIGTPGTNMECLLQSETHEPPEVGEVGELYISGPCLARGYLNQAELTAKQFTQLKKNDIKWYKTGDLCRQLPDGKMEFIRRVDDQVKIRGYRIELGEVEDCLGYHPQIKDIVVLVRETNGDDKQLVAYFTPKDMKVIPTSNDLRHYLRRRLVDYMIPSSFVMLETFPLTANGKLDKKALATAAHPVNKATKKPTSVVEQTLIDIWSDNFHGEKLDVNANFFELGGHSLTAARIILKIQQNLNKKIKLENLYESPTVKELALIVESAEDIVKSNSATSIVFNPSTVIPLSDFQFLFWLSSIFEPQTKKLNIITKRRISGKLDITALNFAFEYLFKTHQVLSYRVSKFSPAQCLKENVIFNIDEKDLRSYSENERETILSNSLNTLLHHYPWKKDAPMMVVRLFYLEENVSELQFSIPHLVFDDASEALLFSELSKGYLLYRNDTLTPSVIGLPQYKNYVHYERNSINQQIDKDIGFWETYLHNTDFVTFPTAEIIKNIKQDESYSTYLELPKEVLKAVQKKCSKYHLSITDILCAAIGLSLKKRTGDLNNNNVLINIIRSMRDDDAFDKMIGCFMRLDPIKMDINAPLDLIEQAKNIQQSRIVTESHQACSSMVKIACLNNSQQHKFIKNYFIKQFTTAYASLFKKSALNTKMLEMYGRLNKLTQQRFMINVNILNNFITPNTNTNLFGFQILKTKIYKYNLSTTRNVLDICLTENESSNTPYLVISGNLNESFRQQLGQDIVENLCLERKPTHNHPVAAIHSTHDTLLRT